MSSNKSSSKTLECWRERPPSTYTIKVNNFTKLQSSTVYSDGKYQSLYFSYAEQKWSLIIYPNGNEKDNGKGFISMYVEIDSTNLSETKQSVYAYLLFSVFNKNENKYFIIQDMDQMPFNSLETTWGLSQVLLRNTFDNPINGFLFEDNCEFGVEIIIAPPPTKLEVVSFDVAVPFPKFSWIVKNFSEIKENPHSSDCILKGGKNWVLKLYPKGYSSPDSKWLSIFLYLADNETLKENEKIYVQAILKIEDPQGCIHKTRQFDHWFHTPGMGIGWDQFVSIAELRKSYLGKEDSVRVEIEFKIISSTAYSSLT